MVCLLYWETNNLKRSGWGVPIRLKLLAKVLERRAGRTKLVLVNIWHLLKLRHDLLPGLPSIWYFHYFFDLHLLITRSVLSIP